ncbi:MAG TPA: amino acid adenylation domain-containing protein [Pyrinomonadaceae bacterium]|nr:amino acid adenylation domain-containing protein [Pyrinomonadaceae bacterium]
MVADKYDLSPTQLGMLIHGSDRDSGAYIQQMLCSLREDLNLPALEKAWQEIVSRHSIFRTSFHIVASPPFQRVHSQVTLSIAKEDWTGMTASDQERALATYLANDRQRSFEPTEAPLTRIALFRMAQAHYEMVWTSHHALMDGRSRLLVLRELFSLYDAYGDGANLELAQPRPYSDYIEWLKQYDLDAAEKFWRDELRGFVTPAIVNLGGSRPLKDDERISHATAETYLSERLTSSMKELAESAGVTLNTLVQASWALMMSRYTGEEEIVFGATRACRRSSIADAGSMVGLFINTLPVRVRVASEELVVPWLQRLRASQVAVRHYEHTPLAMVQEWSEISRGTPLFESIVIFENQQLNEVLQSQGGDWKHRKFRLIEQTNYSLVLNGYGGKQLLLKLEYDQSRFELSAIERMLDHLTTLLQGMVDGPQRRLSDLPLLTEGEKRELLDEWQGPVTKFPSDSHLHELFEQQVERSPNATALVSDEQTFTYSELNARANQLAHYLQKLGVGPDVLVGICIERSALMVVGLLGILKAGGAYLPLDPAYPSERLRFMLQDAGAPVLLTVSGLGDSSSASAQVVCLDTMWERIAQEPDDNPQSKITAQNLAYVIYTSGSTGKPKGSMIPHEGICNRLLWMQDTYQLTESDRVLQKTPFTFDVSVWEFFWPLITGARLVMAKPDSHGDSRYLVETIKQQEITTMHFVPSMLAAFLEDGGVSECRSLRRVICSGEALTYELKERFRKRLPTELHNLYGPTEASVDVTYWDCGSEMDRPVVPIGRPIANTQIYVLDKELQPVPVGVAGELYIGGVGLARGYLQRADLTAERFLPDPFGEKGARIYRTGDLARYLADGNVEYLGRTDHQVKLRGFRIELGEIESALNEHPAVQQAVVTISSTNNQDPRLVAYCVRTQSSDATAGELQAALKRTLPDYMVPMSFVFLEQMPLTSSGKINRRALPQPDAPMSDIVFEAPRTANEEKLAAMWASILKLERVGVHDNFFNLGGHSLLAFQLISRVRDDFKVELPLRRVFETPTVAGLSRWISEAAEQGLDHTGPAIKAIPRQRRTRSSVQHAVEEQ